MTLNTEQKAEIWHHYDTWMTGYLNADVQIYDAYFDDDYHFIGSTNNEEFLNRKDTTKFFALTGEQFAGITTLRNETKILEAFGTSVFLTHVFDGWFLHDKEWTYYGRFRFSSVMQKKEAGWRFIYQHFSMPDLKSDEGQTIGYENITAENFELKEAIKRRTIELEVKNKELEIEAALERVRSRSMAMHKSNELNDVVAILFEKLKDLNIPFTAVGIGIFIEGSKDLDGYVCGENEDGLVIINYRLPYFDNRIPKDLYNAIEKQLDFFEGHYSKEEKDAFYEYVIEHTTEFRHLPENIKRMIFESETYTISMVAVKHAVFNINDFEGKVLAESEIDIIQRFARVFDQAYTRFLDLQKAEAQAREAKIEAALEKVRSRSLAMHRADELGEVVTVVVEKLRDLDFPVNDGVALVTYVEGSKDLIEWMENPGFPSAIKFYQPYFDHPVLSDYWKAKNEGLDFIAPRYTAEENRSFLEHIFEYGDYKNTLQEVKDYCLAAQKYSYSVAFQKNSSIFINDYSGRSLSASEIDILKRFSKIFEQAYIRFLDLQNAEAQARESQIQLALERVRARTMAMQRSDELQDAAILLFQQVQALGVQTGSCGFNIWNKDDKTATVWMSSAEGGFQTPFVLPHTESAIYKQVYEAKDNGEMFFVKEVGGKTLEKHFDYLLTLPGIGEVIKNLRETGYAFPETMVYHFAFFSQGYLSFHLHEHHPETNDIFQRFAKVFEQTYTRFLDLQKAEAQAREARIEAALERVRSRTMAMQSSAELGGVTAELFAQMNQLVTNLWTCGFVLCEKDRHDDEWWLSMDGDFTRGFFLPNVGDYAHATLYEGWLRGEALRAVQLDGEALQQHYDWLMEIPVSRGIFEEMDAAGLARPDWQKLHAAYFSKGYLVLITRELCGEEEIFRRFAQVFDQTYTRFLDLQKAEAQTREAQINLAVERVRAKALAMFKSEEILQVVHKLKDEIMGLNIPNVAAATIHLKAPDGRCRIWDLTSFEIGDDGLHLPLDIRYRLEDTHPDFFMRRVWENEAEYFVVIQEDANFKHTLQWLRDSGLNEQANETEAFFKSTQLKKVYHPTVPLKNGRMCIDLLDSPSPEVASILTKMAGAFDLAYKRFEDLQKAEAQTREAQIQLALERVRARTMAMKTQSDLLGVIELFGSQLISLGLRVEYSSFINGTITKNRDWELWGYSPMSDEPPKKVIIPYIETPYFTKTAKSIDEFERTGNPIQVKRFTKEEKDEFFAHYWKFDPPVSDEAKNYLSETPGSMIIDAFLEEVTVSIVKFETEPYSEEQIDIFKRFSNEFRQTYIRFLDLQKAEAQAKEAQIETALERVRSASMAMHKSDELHKVIQVVANQVSDLGIKLRGANFVTVNDGGSWEMWVATPAQNYGIQIHVPYFDHPFMNDVRGIYKNEDFFSTSVLGFEEKNSFFYHLFENTVAKNTSEEQKKFVLESKGMAISRFRTQSLFLSIYTFDIIPYGHSENEIFKRFANVFEQAYTRFLDLQKAEAQAKEAQIELSLERIRSQVTAMQESSDLLDIVVTMRTEFVKLGHEAHYFWHMRWLPERYDKAMTSGDGTKIGMVMTLPRHIHGEIPLVADWEKTKEPTVVLAMDVETAVDYVEKMITLGDFEQVDPQAPTLDDIRHIGGLTFVMARTTHGEIGYSLPGVVTNPSKNAVDTLVRFAGVFDLAYKRFEDLKAAERQHREGQIELALERVRARAMGMQHSDHLKDVIEVIGHQLHELGLFFDFVNFIVGDTKNGFDTWNVSFGQANPVRFFIPLLNNRVFNETVNARIDGLEFTAYIMTKEETFHFVTHLITNGILKYLPEDALQMRLHSKGMSVSTAVLNEVFLTMANYSAIPYTDEENLILKRFGNAFQQAFTRFLDLQKAEAQARESQIQLALERVRARTMAMQHSDELQEAAILLFHQVQALGVHTGSCGFNIWNKNEKSATVWMSSPEGGLQTPFTLPHMDSAIYKEVYEVMRKGEKFWVKEVAGNNLKEHFDYLLTLPGVGDVIKKPRETGYAFPETMVYHFAFFIQGYLSFHLHEHHPETHDIFKRFAKVFEQTYTRFLDLKKAEAQAREAQIEAALERTRTQSMLMQHSGELNEISKTFHEQLLLLGIDSEFSFVWLPDEEKNEHLFWATWVSEDAGVAQYHSRAINYPLDKTEPGTAACYVAWKSGEPVHETFVPPGDIVSFFAAWEELLTGAEKIRPEFFPDGIYYTEAYMKYGCFGIDIRRRLDADEKEIIRRFAVEFERTYTRFLDLKKAEAQAMEAIKRASVDRVRAEIASMRTTSDLERIQPLIWNELTTLGVPFIRCGVFILMEEKREVQAFLSTPDGKSIAAFHLPYDATEQTKQIVAHWQQKQLFKDHMDEKAFVEYTQNLVQQGAVASDEKYVTENRPTDLYLHFLPFLQGMMYVGNNAPLNEDELQLVQNLADAFSTAYARYEDFNKLKVAKAAVESAMSELKATQSQLVQQEKLASLGQLTAGIAHEIKNPLNFVNNFTEVSIELIEEALEEIVKHEDVKDTSLINQNLEDIKSNLKKVYDHGTRANSIVNSMLMHSRGGGGSPEPTPLNDFIREYSNLAFHGMRASNSGLDVQMIFNLDEKVKDIPLIAEDFSRVVLNICNNAFDACAERSRSAMREKKMKYEVRSAKYEEQNTKYEEQGTKYEKQNTKYEEGEDRSGHYVPTLSIQTRLVNGNVLIHFKDNGLGIPDEIKDKILQPFFTTKKGTEGTGLGLSISNDIVKAHGGELKVDATEGQGSVFSIVLPVG